MRLSDLRGSSALQYETDIGLVLNSKYDIVSREHLIYNLSDAETMRGWVVLSVEKNRAGVTPSIWSLPWTPLTSASCRRATSCASVSSTARLY